MTRSRQALVSLLGVAAIAAVGVTAGQAGPSPAFNTGQAPMLMAGPGAPAGYSADALISVGDTLAHGYRFEAIPDGISIVPRQGGADVYVNHETSTVPFPFNANWPQAGGVELNQNDFDNSQVSKLFIHANGNIASGSMAIRSLENFQRFCSSYLATAKEGFSRPILFQNEEAQDWIYRSGSAWPGPNLITPGTAGAEQAGVVVGYDVATGARKPLYSMGRFNHENTVAVPGYHELVTLSGDDTFATGAPASSQVYMYTAPDTNTLINDKGTLHALSAISTSENDYFDIQPGDTPVDVEFVPVPTHIATGKDSHGKDLLASDLGYPAPVGIPIDGPQWVLDQWGNVSNTPSLNNDVFDFIRIEDIAYDKRPGMSNVLYLADSGRATGGAANPLSVSTNGRIWKLVLDKHNPRLGKLSVLVQGDDTATGLATGATEIHQPDNVDTTVHGSLLVTEDPSTNNQYNLPRDPGETGARIWRVPLGAADPDASKVVVAEVDQALDENANGALGAIDVDAATAARLGAWESSGIVDASAVFGPGAFLVTIQAHSYWVEKLVGPDLIGNAGADYYYKREAGQLILLRLPGV